MSPELTKLAAEIDRYAADLAVVLGALLEREGYPKDARAAALVERRAHAAVAQAQQTR